MSIPVERICVKIRSTGNELPQCRAGVAEIQRDETAHSYIELSRFDIRCEPIVIP